MSKRSPLPVIVTFFLLLCAPLYGSTFYQTGPRINALQQIDDVAMGSIFAMAQDEAGFLWLAGSEGLKRFDGQSIKTFTHEPHNKNSLPDNFVSDMVIDEQGIIWLATNKGLSRFNPKTLDFNNFQFDENDPNSISANRIYDLALGKGSTLWLGTMDGINRFDRHSLNNKRFTEHLLGQQKPAGNMVLNILEDSKGRLWYTIIRQGLFVYDPAQGTNIPQKANPKDENRLYNDNVITIYQSKNGDIWTGGPFYLHKYIENKQHFVRYPLPKKEAFKPRSVNVKRLFEDQQGNLWIATLYNGVNLLPAGSDQVINLNEGPIGENTFKDARVYSVFGDSSGTLWFGTRYNGLVKLHSNAMKLRHFSGTENDKLDITALRARSDGSYYVAGNRNLYLKRPNEPFELLLKDIGEVKAMVHDSQGKLILNIFPKGIYVYDATDGGFYEHASSNENLPNLPDINMQTMTIDDKGDLWFGQFKRANIKRSGIFKYSVSADTFTHVINDFTALSVLAYQDKVLMGTTRKGVHLLDTATGQWQRLDNPKADIGAVIQLYKDSEQRIWAATANAGLALLDLETLKLSFIKTSDGLPSNAIRSIIEDNKGRLWLGTDNGLASYHPQKHQIRVFNHNHGLIFKQFYPKGALRTSDGKIVMTSRHQLLEFSPEQLSEQTVPREYPVMLSNFRILNRPVAPSNVQPGSVLPSTINYVEDLTLTYRDYLFSLSFASANYQNELPQRFAYRMYGFRNDWIETSSSKNNATFTSLPAGDYQLQIKASRSDGSWSENYRKINLSVTPPWYLSNQAYVVYVVLTVLMIFMYIRMREARLVKQARQLENTVTQRTEQLRERSEQLQQSRDQVSDLLNQKERTFANISHEFKTPLTLILSPLETLLSGGSIQALPQEAQNKLMMMKRNGSRLLRMVEQVLELSRLDTAVNQNQRHYSLKETLTVLLTSFEPLLHSKSLKLTTNEFKDVVLTMRVDSLEMILTNLLSNAIKYTPENGAIEVEIKIDDLFASVSVKDNGMGISEPNQALVFNRFTRASEEHDENIPGAGIGLALVKELVENHKGQITLKSELNQGSTFTVRLPFNPDPDVQPQSIEHISSTSKTEIDALIGKTQVTEQTDIGQIDDNGKATVLLIDDNADMLQLLTDTLNGRYHCITAANGESGLEKAKALIPDFIISDVMMPGISGYEVAKALKEEELTCHIPVILLTAKGDIDSRMEGWKQDIDDYLAKPFHPQELLLRIESLLSIRAILKKRFIQSQQDGTSGHDDDNNTQPIYPAISDKDARFVNRLKEVINHNYRDCEFNRDTCASKMGISERQLSRKMSALMNESFPDLLRDHRLDCAVDLMQTGMQISQISDEVGFSALSYFGKCFKAKYGKTPKQYQKDVIL